MSTYVIGGLLSLRSPISASKTPVMYGEGTSDTVDIDTGLRVPAESVLGEEQELAVSTPLSVPLAFGMCAAPVTLLSIER